MPPHHAPSTIRDGLADPAIYAVSKIATVTEQDQKDKQAAIQGLQDAFLKKFKVPKEAGEITLAGDKWPESKLYQNNMKEALGLARKDIVRAVMKASAAIMTGDKKACKVMETWFGVAGDDKVNWKVVRSNLRVIEYYLLNNISFEYDPTASFFAATYGGTKSMKIEVGPALFDPDSKVMKPKDSANVAYTIIHEASHNVCRTHDHRIDGKMCYGEELAKQMAEEIPWKAWDTAACYQFFCANLGA